MPQLSLEQQADLASLAYELGHNPQTRAGLAELIHKVYPQRARASFPDVAHEAAIRREFSKIREELDLNGAKAAKARLEEGKAKLKERYSDDDIAKIEQEMDRSGIASYEDAAILYAAKHAPAEPAAPPPPSERPGARWEFPTVADRHGKPVEFKNFVADPNRYAVDAAYNVISEFKNSKLSPPFRR